LEVLTEKYKELGESGDESTKKLILKNNLYGIDLDEKAVEIARLNLSINSLDKKVKLPELTKNIKCGNSLISDDVAVLKKYFGVGYRAKQVFNWSEEFPEVFQQGGFDVVIGNPPYGAELSAEDQAYFKKAYDIGSTDTAILFIKKATENLKKGGVLGFIIPKAFCFASNYEKVRNLVWDDTAAIVDCGKVWTAVKLEQVIVLIKKENPSTTYESGVVEEEKVKTVGNIDKAIAKQFGFFLNGVSNEEVQVAQKMLKNKLTLNEIAINQRGAMLQKEIGSEGDTTVLGGAQIAREGIRGAKGKIDRARIDDEKAFIKPNAVLVQNIVSHIENPVAHIKIIAAIPPKESRYTILDTVNQLILEKQYSPYVIWAILNSHLLNWYAYRFIFGKAIRTMHFDNSVTSRIPIPDTLEGSETLGSLAAEALKLQEEQVVLEENSNVWVRLKNEIQKVQHQIDMEVYALYGLAAKDVTIVQKEPPAVEGELG
jgi:predicted RNA methylase